MKIKLFECDGYWIEEWNVRSNQYKVRVHNKYYKKPMVIASHNSLDRAIYAAGVRICREKGYDFRSFDEWAEHTPLGKGRLSFEQGKSS